MSEVLSYLSTGLYALDCALGGGLLAGHISELYGDTADVLALVMGSIRATQAAGGEVAFLDCSGTLDPAVMAGSGVTYQRLLVSCPSTEVQAMEIVDMLARASIALVIVAGTFEAPIDPHAPIFTDRTRTVSEAVRALEVVCRKSGSHVLFLRGPSEKRFSAVGATAARFYAAQRVQVRGRGPLLTCIVTKNKEARAMAAAKVRLIRANG